MGHIVIGSSQGTLLWILENQLNNFFEAILLCSVVVRRTVIYHMAQNSFIWLSSKILWGTKVMTAVQ